MSASFSFFRDPHGGGTSLFSVEGRIGRRQYLTAGLGLPTLAGLVVWPLLQLLGSLLDDGVAEIVVPLLALLVGLPAVLVWLVSAVKRLHDLGRSAWWLLLYLVPAINVALLLWQLLARGRDEPNVYGPTTVDAWPWSRGATMPDPDADERARREPVQPRRMVRLDVAGGPSLRLALDRPVLLGRSRRCDVVLSGDPLVSGKHARLSLRAGDVLLEDLVSSNGTRLNGRPLRGPQRVAHGDLITLGRTSIRIHA